MFSQSSPLLAAGWWLGNLAWKASRYSAWASAISPFPCINVRVSYYACACDSHLRHASNDVLALLRNPSARLSHARNSSRRKSLKHPTRMQLLLNVSLKAVNAMLFTWRACDVACTVLCLAGVPHLLLYRLWQPIAMATKDRRLIKVNTWSLCRVALLQPLLQPVQGGLQVPEQIQPDAVEEKCSLGRRPEEMMQILQPIF